MPIISKIGRKSIKVRALFGGMYIFLFLGGVAMVYPFLLMVAGSTKSGADLKFFDMVPRFVYNETWLYRKHMESLFNEELLNLTAAYNADEISFDTLNVPRKHNPSLAVFFEKFLSEYPLPFFTKIGGTMNTTPISKTVSFGLREFKNMLAEKYGNDISKVNKEIDSAFIAWNLFITPRIRYVQRREKPVDSRFTRHMNEFINTRLPAGLVYLVSLEGYYVREFIRPRYASDIRQYNKVHGTSYTSFSQITLTQRYPRNAPKTVRDEWELFVMKVAALHWLQADDSALTVYQTFLRAKYQTTQNLNRYYGTAYGSFQEVPLVKKPPLSGIVFSDWEHFFNGWTDPVTKKKYIVPITAIFINSADFMFRDYVIKTFGTLDAANKALGTSYSDYMQICMPQQDFHYSWFLANKKSIRNEFLTRNYRAVAEYIIFRGRGVLNTVIYTALAVLTALIINPIAAYAMSRYKMPSTYKLLLFLLCTMAFPPMVTQIPNFLMLRRLGLLNTFAALILPGMANGYSIFLIKGFFDAQPKELYESAQIDGASEWVLFWKLTMSLSKPILAVIALSAFTAAYSDFMFAFIICQDEKMWTLMVWLYQLQQRSGQAVMYASLIIAAVPTFLIFLFAQNIIMRGIVVPSEK